MAADSTVNIDVILHKDQAQQSAKELDQALKETGKDAGDKAEKNIEDNVQKASEKTKGLVTNINRWVDEKGQIHIDVYKQRADESIEEFKERVKRVPKKPKIKPDVDTDSANEKIDGLQKKVTKIPKEVRTELIAQAKSQGIENFDKLLKQLPKEQRTELVAKVQKGEVINYEEELRKVPANVLTKLELNDKASPTLQKLQTEADVTERKFTSLKDIIKGTFVGSLLATGANSIIGYLHGIAGEAIATSDAMYKFKQTMKLGGYGEEEIAKASKEVKKYADETVYDLSDITNTSAQLASNGIKGYQRLTEAAGNLNAQAGGNAETFKSVAMVMTQTAGAGKLTTENWNQLTDAIAGASGPLQKAMKDNGAYTGNFRDAMAQGQITAGEFFDAIEKLGTTKGAEEAAKSTETFEGAVGNLEAQIITTMDKVIDRIGKKRITNAINGITKMVADLTEGLVNVFDFMASHTGIAKTLLGVMIGIFATKRIFNFIAALGEAKLAMMAFNQTAGANPLGGKVPSPKTTADKAADTAADVGGAVTGTGVRGMLRSVGSRVIKASPYAAGAIMAGTELLSNNSVAEKTGGITGALSGAVGGKALGAAIGTMIAPGMGTAIGGFLGGTAGSFIGQKLGEAIGKGADEHFKAHPITVKTKYKTSTDNKAMDKDLTPSINKVNKTVLRMDVDSASIQKAQQKTDKYFDEMSKKVDSYYKKKADGYKKDEEASKKNLDALVKNGKMSQAEEDKALKKQQENDQKKIKSDDAAAKQRKKVLEQMRKDTNDYYAKVSKIENDANKSEKQKQKELQKAQATYVKKQYKDQLDANKKITSYVKQGANTQEKIYEQLVKKRGQLDMKDLKATQKAANQKYNAAVKPARKARDEIVKEAEKEYKDTVKTAEKEYKEHHTISKKKYKEIVADAKAQRDGVTKAADDEYNKTTKKASDQHKKVTGEINQQKNDVINAANAQSSSHISAAGAEMSGVNGNYSSGFSGAGRIWNKFLDGVKAVLKFFNQNSKGVPSVPTGYAVGTGALTNSQIALVGEEGPELAHTPTGYEMLGINGPELRYLSAGTSILTHGQTKTAMALNGGKIPGYAKGTGAKITDFVDDVKYDAMDALDLLGKGVAEVWDWLKQKTGLDSMLSSQQSMGGVKRTTHGTFDYAKDAISNFIKKMADKFLESLSGSVSPELVKAAAKLMHVDVSAGDVSHILNVIQHESGGKAGAVNNWDSNAKAGHPSKGILQFVQSTFDNYAMLGHTNILNPLDQLLAMFNDSTWRSDLTLGGWSPRGGRRYANGGWTDEPAIFGEVQGEPELAVNPKRDSSEEHIAEAIEARAKVNPNGFAGNLSKIINEAKQSANNMLPFISTGNNHVKTASNVQQAQSRVDGNINITMNIDSKQVSRAVYPTLKAMRSHEVIINGVGGAVPVGNGQPLGGVY
ncbi:tape measure protein [Limosilactobacillus reuteri]